MSETYFIDGRISQQGHLLACPKCGRKILVEIALNGVSHNVSVVVICAECMVVEDVFARDYPDIARQLKEWAAATPAESA